MLMSAEAAANVMVYEPYSKLSAEVRYHLEPLLPRKLSGMAMHVTGELCHMCICMQAQLDQVQAAGQAAAQACGGDLDGPAAAAARRAAASGLAASRQGFKGLGGASAHMAALRELVALPLQASPCSAFAWLLLTLPCT